MEALALQGGAQLHQERLHGPWGGGIGAFTGRGGGIGPGHAMNVIQLLGLFIPGSQVGVAQFPVRGGAFLQLDATELLFAHALKHAPPDLGVAADGMHHLG